MPRHLALIFVSILLNGSTALAQGEERVERWREDCERHTSGDRARSCEVRRYTTPRASNIVVDGRRNGGISFFGADRGDVLVVAMVQAQARTDAEARALAKQVRVVTDGGRIHAEGPNTSDNASWSVSYHVYVPRQSNLEAETGNGGVSAQLVNGTMRFRTTNGGISLNEVGGDVRGQTTNGGVRARLTGSTWNGRGLDLRTTNGGVSLTIPRGYNARLETGTTNGGMRVDFPVTVQGRIGRTLETQLGSGGPVVRAVTTNGGITISER